ncbi:MAG: hypothetical protein HZC40_23165 [Chloroflexi bacterium]|nr:hypothetical protein [Chloroflexota bacterium]
MNNFDPRPYLDKLETLVDVAWQNRAEQKQLSALKFEPLDFRPTIITTRAPWSHLQFDFPPGWIQIPYREAFRDPAKMLISELMLAYEGALLKDDRVFTIRPNYGLILTTSILGAAYSQDEDNMPWALPVESLDDVRAIIARGMPDLNAGIGAQIWETEAYFRDTLAQYPKLAQTVHIGHPDPQGPFNFAVNLAGVAIYEATLEEPQLIHDLLDFYVPIAIAVINKHRAIVGDAPDEGYKFLCRQIGGACIPDDSGVMLSQKMYREFCVPYNARVATAVGGALGHFCGRGNQFYEEMVNTPGVTSINFGNPEMQNLVARHAIASEHKTCLMWDGEIPPEAAHIHTGIIHRYVVNSWAEAVETRERVFGAR